VFACKFSPIVETDVTDTRGRVRILPSLQALFPLLLRMLLLKLLLLSCARHLIERLSTRRRPTRRLLHSLPLAAAESTSTAATATTQAQRRARAAALHPRACCGAQSRPQR